MTWGERSTIPAKVKATVRRRDGHCQLQFDGCTGRIEEFHHPNGLADQGQQRTPVRHAREVIGVCAHCHGIDTRQRQAAGRQRARQTRGGLSRARRDLEPHPGRIAP